MIGKVQKNNIWNNFCKIIHIYCQLNQFNLPLLNKSINFYLKKIFPQTHGKKKNGSVAQFPQNIYFLL